MFTISKRTLWAIMLATLIVLSVWEISFASAQEGTSFDLSSQEKKVLEAYRGRTLLMGLDPDAGIEYFEDIDGYHGYAFPLAQLLSESLGLEVKVMGDKSWGAVYRGLHNGEVDILLGANVTPERLEIMQFSSPVYSVPYTVLAQADSGVQTVGDLHRKRIGFIAEDIGLESFKNQYNKISFDTYLYPDQSAALEGLISGEVDGFITSGGDIVYDYLFNYTSLREIARLDTIRSELTLSARKQDAELIEIIQRLILSEKPKIDAMVHEARQYYIRKLIRLTPKERSWLESKPTLKVGVATDYLPVDYYDQGQYKGIAGHFLSTFSQLIGLELEAVPGPFDTVYTKALKGEIDILNMAKTDERMANFLFTNPFSDERDEIYGLRAKPYVYDTYGLEGKRVAVIEGFWHEQLLQRNLTDVTIVKVKDIKEALNALVMFRADYFIETPAVAEYYIVGLGYTNIIKKGETSAESFLYFGAQKSNSEFVSIFNKMLPLMNYSESKYIGVQGVPQQKNVANSRLAIMLSAAFIALVLLMVTVISVVKKLSKQSSEMLLLKERERLIYLDPLTQLFNRNYFNRLEATMDSEAFPQHMVMFDLNDLKVINDQFGHLVGDQLICQFAQILKQVDQKGIAIRMGGDEFVLWLLGIDTSEVQSIVQRLRMKCQQATLVDAAKEDTVLVKGIVVSLGYASRLDPGKSVEQCLKEADAAMYQDKAHLKQVVKQ